MTTALLARHEKSQAGSFLSSSLRYALRVPLFFGEPGEGGRGSDASAEVGQSGPIRAGGRSRTMGLVLEHSGGTKNYRQKEERCPLSMQSLNLCIERGQGVSKNLRYQEIRRGKTI